ncbi:hypothetical protein MJO28_000337 [Puccinia striiformis f. sp. tritici]|uniref:Uncharacterized protein n=4 Tax=Puccinia striiformis TaxID=27350 RepID=A0A0L0VY27_9BASI|nr:hypothetical protein Pst134EA_000895 [Puccinia striiformis f. sp. tritici]KAI9628303.1 hypothetical protein H4Q26_018104 [Puccinia striiformis f. sp. tritici PST-130]KNF04208.1 hypothetical protein PSTG_02559 [Puccinia striiformis f. sp. tritici PST-78]POW08608.1 hypothetical protein PSHT_09503 [Puccinia striiformis]KAH9467083.1 hypothetical protein Pst134EB_002111 [Puccinia striiformis f. sp. tritici]KAH9473832.1 hypothetical protein Pst134EA_000895 [Puccinia striiformis f. sp. tritici]
MQSAADQFLASLDVPNPDKIMIQLNDTKEKLRDTESILEILREALETMRGLPDGRDKELLVRELQSNINRHELLFERESVKLSVKEKYLKNVLKREVN